MIAKYLSETNESKCPESVEQTKTGQRWKEKFVSYKLQMENKVV